MQAIVIFAIEFSNLLVHFFFLRFGLLRHRATYFLKIRRTVFPVARRHQKYPEARSSRHIPSAFVRAVWRGISSGFERVRLFGNAAESHISLSACLQ